MYRALLVFASYLVGTFPTARLLVPGITTRGSGNPGTSNAYRLAGPATAAKVFLGDAGKGILATTAGALAGGRALALACGLAAVAGHCFPVRPRPTADKGGKGGKGVATAAGMVAVVAPVTAALAAAAWLVVVRATGTASLASLTAAAIVPVATAVTGRPWWEVAALTGAAIVIVLRHRSNVRDLVRGEERSLR